LLVNIKGEIVINKSDADSLPTKYIMERPELVLFVNKTGSNTNQKCDPFKGNEINIDGSNGDALGLSGIINDNNFTVMCFQAATGEPVMLAIIFKSDNKAKDVPVHWETGINLRKLQNKKVLPGEVETIGKLYIDFETKDDAALSGGPVCTFCGKKIPSYCFCSASASITSDILTDVLRYIDSHKVYNRLIGENPILI
jgi:hypothetical protein